MQSEQQSVEYALEFAVHELNHTEWKTGNHHLVAAALLAWPDFRNISKPDSPTVVETQVVPASYASAYLRGLE